MWGAVGWKFLFGTIYFVLFAFSIHHPCQNKYRFAKSSFQRHNSTTPKKLRKTSSHFKLIFLPEKCSDIYKISLWLIIRIINVMQIFINSHTFPYFSFSAIQQFESNSKVDSASNSRKAQQFSNSKGIYLYYLFVYFSYKWNK